MTEKSLLRLVDQWDEKGPENTSVDIVDGNPFDWEVTIYGTSGSDYEGGTFRLSVKFPDDYPRAAPVVRFITPVYNCGVFPDGTMCLQTINSWTSVSSVVNVITEIVRTLYHSDGNNGANPEACEVRHILIDAPLRGSLNPIFLLALPQRYQRISRESEGASSPTRYLMKPHTKFVKTYG